MSKKREEKQSKMCLENLKYFILSHAQLEMPVIAWK